MKFMALFFSLSLLVSCAGTTSTPFAKNPPLGQVVRVKGVAVNTKLSAAIQTNSMLFYCIEIPEWPEDVAGRTVDASGRLEKTDQFKARTGAAGERSAGTAGGDFLLRSISWQVE
ncbi:MAG: hypothetical protein QF645_13115 [Planctomycetota bacterium]|nr:hypothetical protein [Planctomycetota bacterium]